MDIRLVKKNERDSEFFKKLFGEIKSSELQLNSWPESIKRQMIDMQYRAFEKSMKAEFSDWADYVILFQSKKAGRLELFEDEKGIRIINISLLPAFRNKGIGAYILNNILVDANQKGKPVHLKVDKINPAFNLYGRLGFRVVQENDIRYSMAYYPESSTNMG